MLQPNRRSFLKGSAAAAATFAIAGTKASGKIIGANETIRIGVAGLNGRGSSHVDAFSKMDGVQVTYLVDPDQRTWERRAKTVEERGGKAPKCVQDIRKALDDGELDAISIATPNHWHALMTVWGCQAGKDVYVEKPSSHNVREGRIAVDAARKYDRIVQHGTQSRSSQEWAGIADIAASGKYGKLLVSRALCYKPRGSIGLKPNKQAPAELDYSLWLGPALDLPYNENLVHYNWHWFWPFGNGDIGNQGVHQMDIARWMIPGGARLPRSVVSLGGRFGYEDQGETPNTQIAVMDYGDDQPQLVFEVRGLDTEGFLGEKVGNILHFEEGTIAGGKFIPNGSDRAESLPKVEAKRGPGGDDHFANFIEAVRSRDSADLNADIEEGHLSSALCHLTNVSYLLGAPVPFAAKSEAVGGDPEALGTFNRMEEHLKVNGVDLDGLNFQLGRRLTIDADTESIAGDPDASRLLTRAYRPPFVVPDKI